jgi:hypothetical protein
MRWLRWPKPRSAIGQTGRTRWANPPYALDGALLFCRSQHRLRWSPRQPTVKARSLPMQRG